MSTVLSRIGTELLHIMSAFSEASEQFGYALQPGLLPELSWPTLPPLDCGNNDDVAVNGTLALINNPENVALVFNPPAGTRLGPGTHTLKATATDTKYNGLSAEGTVTVKLLNPRLTWPKPKAVTWTAGGFDFSTVAASVDNPRGVALTFDPPQSEKLTPGRHTLKVRATDKNTYLQTEVSVVLSVDKALAEVKLVLPDHVDWTPGGYELPQKVANTEPPDLALDVKPDRAKKLQPGQYTLKATVAESESYVGSAEARFTVDRIDARLAWKLPPSVLAEGPTLLLTDELLKSWVDNPMNIELAFNRNAGEKLAPGKVALTVQPVDVKNYLPKVIPAELVVKGTPTTLKWKPKQSVEYERGGFTLSAEVLARLVDNPDGLELEFDPPEGKQLPLEEHTLKMRPKDAVLWENTWIHGSIQVRKPKVRIEWKPEPLPWHEDGVELDGTTLNAVITPPWVKVRYEPDVGDILDTPGANDLYLHVVDPNCERETFKKSVELTTNSHQRQLLKVKASTAKGGQGKGGQKARKLDEETVNERWQAYQLLLQQPIPSSYLNSEYPYGAANTTPHIHKYGTDFHLKTAQGDRINLVQQGKRYEPSIKDALAEALEFDLRSARGKSPTNLHGVLTALLK